MDKFLVHLHPIPRTFPSATPVANIGYIPLKTDRIQRTFTSFNFSFVLKGNGDYFWRGKSLPVIAPCVLTQWPGIPSDYGPKKDWEELFLIYDGKLLKSLRRLNFATLSRPLWYLQDAGILRRRTMELSEILTGGQHARQIDRIDRMCESIIMESLIGQSPPPESPQERKVREIRTLLEERYLENHDFDELAVSHGFSPAVFRRYWQKYVGPPPGRYVMQLRIRNACRLLAETELPIGDIAAQMQFDDQLYFSRKFHLATGMSATEYRNRYRHMAKSSVGRKRAHPVNA